MRTATLIGLMLLTAGPAIAETEADRQFTFASLLMTEGQATLADEAFADFIREFSEDKRLSDAWYYRALLAMQRNDQKTAQVHLNRATKPLTVSPSSVSLLRGQLALADGRAKQAVAHLSLVKADDLGDTASRASWHYLLGAAHRAANQPEAAVRQFAKAAEARSPVYERAQLELGKTRIVLNQHNAAFEALNELATQSTDTAIAAEASSLAAALAYQLKQFEQSAALYDRLTRRYAASPHAARARLGVMRAMLAAGQYDKVVEQHAAHAARLPAEGVTEGLYLRAAALVQLKRYDDATATLQQFTQRAKADDALRPQALELAGVCLFHQNPDAFERWFAANRPASAQLGYYRAVAAEERGEKPQAIAHLTALLALGESTYTPEALLARARLYEQTNQHMFAANDLAAFARRFDTDARAVDAGARAIDMALRANDAKAANEMATAWLAKHAKHPNAGWVSVKQALAQIRLKQTDKATATLDAVLANKPDKSLEAFTRFYRGVLLAGDAKPNTPATAAPALAELTKAQSLGLPDGQQVQAIALAARLHRLVGQEAKSLAAYEQLRAAQPNARYAPATALWIGRGLLDRGQPKQAIEWLKLPADADNADDKTIAAARYYLGQAYLTAEQWDNAVNAFGRQLATTDGFGEQGRLGLAMAYAGRGDRDRAIEEYNGLLRADSSRVSATALIESAKLHLQEAERLQAAGTNTKAAEHVTEAQRRLNRVVLLHDLPQLAPLPVQAKLLLARVEGSVGEQQRARDRLTAITQTDDEWAALANAELHLLEGRKADARAAWQQLTKSQVAAVADIARTRLSSLGGVR